jgi:hypothetical protein
MTCSSFLTTRKAHLRYLEIVFTTLWHYRLYLGDDKVEFMAPRMEALRAIITDEGIEVDPSKAQDVQHAAAKADAKACALWDMLSEFDSEREFIPGRENTLADSLSRRPL